MSCWNIFKLHFKGKARMYLLPARYPSFAYIQLTNRCGTLRHSPQYLLPMGKQLVLVCKRLTQGKIATGNVHGSVKKNKRICHDSSQGKVYGIVRTQRVSANHEKLKCTKHYKTLFFMLCSSWRQIIRGTGSTKQQDYRALLEVFLHQW